MSIDTETTPKMSTGRVVAVALAAAVAFVVGFYAGFAALLSVVTFDDFRAWQFTVSTLPSGGMLAGVAAALAAPAPARRVLGRTVGAALAAALAVVIVLLAVDGDFGVAIGVGGAAVVTASTVATVASVKDGG
jgi:hypothetical protein